MDCRIQWRFCEILQSIHLLFATFRKQLRLTVRLTHLLRFNNTLELNFTLPRKRVLKVPWCFLIFDKRNLHKLSLHFMKYSSTLILGAQTIETNQLKKRKMLLILWKIENVFYDETLMSFMDSVVVTGCKVRLWWAACWEDNMIVIGFKIPKVFIISVNTWMLIVSFGFYFDCSNRKNNFHLMVKRKNYIIWKVSSLRELSIVLSSSPLLNFISIV